MLVYFQSSSLTIKFCNSQACVNIVFFEQNLQLNIFLKFALKMYVFSFTVVPRRIRINHMGSTYTLRMWRSLHQTKLRSWILRSSEMLCSVAWNYLTRFREKWRSHLQRSSSLKPCTVWPLRMGPIGFPEMSLKQLTHLRCVISQKSEDLTYTEAEVCLKSRKVTSCSNSATVI
jgi:hypothetical protein